MIPFMSKSKAAKTSPCEWSQKSSYLSEGQWSWRGKRVPSRCWAVFRILIWWYDSMDVYTRKSSSAAYLTFVPFSACKQYLKRYYLREFSILREGFPPASVKTQSRSLQQPRCLRAGWWWWRKAEMTTWPTPRFCWDLFTGSYGSITQNLNQKRHSPVMSMWTNYSIRFIMLWFWPPPGYFWPQGQLKWCGP